MESHISHIFADLFTSRPKSYSHKGLKQLLKIRLLKVNGYNIKDIYLKNLNKKTTNKENIEIKKVDKQTLYYENKYDITYKVNLKKKFV